MRSGTSISERVLLLDAVRRVFGFGFWSGIWIVGWTLVHPENRCGWTEVHPTNSPTLERLAQQPPGNADVDDMDFAGPALGFGRVETAFASDERRRVIGPHADSQRLAGVAIHPGG